MMYSMNPHSPSEAPYSSNPGFSLLEVLTALTIFSGSYMALISAHAHITSHTQKQVRDLHALIEINNQHEIQIALTRAEANE